MIVDGELAFVGGIDMTDYAGDRFDTNAHPARRRLGWHDVGSRLRGPAVIDVHDHFALRWREITGERLERPPMPAADGGHTVQVVRTVAENMYDLVPTGEFRILESYVRAIRSAQRFVYLENQFLWAPEIVDLLADKLRRPPCDEFRVVVVLPAKANNGHDDTMGQLGVLVGADDDAERLLATTIRSLTGHRDDRLYVHAKVGIVDDRWLTVGSANLNAHSLLNDTEMNVITDDPDLAQDTRLRLWSEHLGVDVADEDLTRSSTSAGARSPSSSSSACAPATRPRIGCWRCRASPSVPPVARAARRPGATARSGPRFARRPWDGGGGWAGTPISGRPCPASGHAARAPTAEQPAGARRTARARVGG